MHAVIPTPRLTPVPPGLKTPRPRPAKIPAAHALQQVPPPKSPDCGSPASPDAPPPAPAPATPAAREHPPPAPRCAYDCQCAAPPPPPRPRPFPSRHADRPPARAKAGDAAAPADPSRRPECSTRPPRRHLERVRRNSGPEGRGVTFAHVADHPCEHPVRDGSAAPAGRHPVALHTPRSPIAGAGASVDQFSEPDAAPVHAFSIAPLDEVHIQLPDSRRAPRCDNPRARRSTGSRCAGRAAAPRTAHS
jgi:hypothetical protein